MEPIHLRYQFTPGYVARTVWISSILPLLVFSVVGLGMIIIGFENTDLAGKPDLGSILLGLSLVLLLWLGTPLILLWRMRKMLGQPIEVAFDDNGMRQDARGMHFQGDWSTLRTITRRGPYLIAKLQSGGAIGLPTAAFASAGQADAFLTMAQARLAASREQAAAS